MQDTIEARCNNGHRAIKACAFKKCSHPSLICPEPNCIYFSLHKGCTYIDTYHIIGLLRTKARKLKQKNDTLIMGCISQMIKKLEMMKADYLKVSDNYASNLKGDQRELLEMLMNKETHNLKPELVYSVLQSLSDEEGQYQEENKKLEEIIKKAKQEQKASIQELQKYYKEKQKIDFRFTDELSNLNQIMILKEGKGIKRIKQDDYHTYSLVSPSIAEAFDKSLKLKVIKKHKLSSIFIGVASKQYITNNAFTCGAFEGIQIINNDGFIYNPWNKDQNGKFHDFKFRQDDVLQIKYVQKSNALQVKNLTRNIVFQLDKIPHQFQDLHYCTATDNVDVEWEIL